jgi:hypothetical protein
MTTFMYLSFEDLAIFFWWGSSISFLFLLIINTLIFINSAVFSELPVYSKYKCILLPRVCTVTCILCTVQDYPEQHGDRHGGGE